MKFNTDGKLLKGFNSQPREARLYVNGSPTAVEVFYESLPTKEQQIMIIKNLSESYPYIRFNRMEYNMIIESSNNGIEWIPSEEQEENQQIQIYRIFDPNIIISGFEFEKSQSFESNGMEFIRAEGYYSIDQSNELPTEVKAFFKMEKDSKRWIRITTANNELFAMTQRDFPPFTDTLSLKFSECCEFFSSPDKLRNA